MDSNHDKVIQSHLCYRYTTRQITILSPANYEDVPQTSPKSGLTMHGVFQSQNLQEILPSASPDTASKMAFV
jgi:hypothetical protein